MSVLYFQVKLKPNRTKKKILFKARRKSYLIKGSAWMYTLGSTHLFENVNWPDWYTHGHYKEIMGVNNKFPDFTL